MRLFKAAARWLSLLLIPVTVSALGLGDIAVKSSLNQPFVAEIPLEALESTALSELTVELASPETFRRYGLDRPAYLSNIRFSVETRADGKPVIRLTSTQPIAEPFVTILLDVRWPSGRLLREYTALLDPPLFEQSPVPAEVKPAQVAPETRPSPAASSVNPAPEVPVQEDDIVEPTGLFQQPRIEATDSRSDELPATPGPSADVQPGETAAVPSTPEPAADAATAPAAADAYTARNGDTLWGIAQRVRGGTGLNINQMMLALYRANPEAFMGNINALKAGAILRIDPVEAADAPTVAEANAEVQQQIAAWSKPAQTSSEQTAEEAQARLQLVPPSEEAAGQTEPSASGAEKTSAGAATGDVSGQLQTRINTLEQQLDESKRLLSVRDAELQALQQRIADLEKSGSSQQPVPAVPEELQAEEPVETVEPAAEAPATEQPPAEAPVVASEPVPEPVTEQPVDEQLSGKPEEVVSASVGDEISASSFPGNIFIWAGAAGLLLLLAVFVVRRRNAAGADVAADIWADNRKNIDLGEARKDFSDLPSHQDSIVVEEGRFTDTDTAEAFGAIAVAPSANAGQDQPNAAAATDKFTVDDFAVGDLDTQEAVGQDEVELPLEKTISTGAPLNLDQADPVAEAEFHMAYGLYDQAADLLTRALKDDPDNRAYRLKLIEVYFVWENKEGFLEQARALRNGSTNPADSDWNKVMILGKQLCPSDPLFSGATSSPVAGAMDLVLSDAGETSVDFSVSADDSGVVDVNFDPSSGNSDGLDFDLNSGFGLDSKSVDDAQTMESPTLDVIGAGSPTVAVDFNMDGGETMESPTLASPANEPTVESPGLRALTSGGDVQDDKGASKPSSNAGMFDREPPIDPTGIDIDLSGLADLPLDGDDFGSLDAGSSAEIPAPVFGDDNKRLAPETENIYVGSEGATMFANIEQLGKVAGDTHELPIDLQISDTAEQPQFNDGGSDTAEQPGIAEPAEFGGDFDDLILSNESKSPDDATMTEVGTKLDLARAYIDMGDPEGARSILEEVLDEGGEAQQQQARQLLNELND